MMSVAELMMLCDGDLCLQLLIDARLLFMLKSSNFYFSPCYAFIIRFCCHYFPAKSWLVVGNWVNVKRKTSRNGFIWIQALAFANRKNIHTDFFPSSLTNYILRCALWFLSVKNRYHFGFSVLVLATSKIMNVKKLLILRKVLFFIFSPTPRCPSPIIFLSKST